MLALKASLRAYHAANNLWETPDPGLIPFLTRLRARGLRRVVVSNANGTLHAHFDRMGLTPHFEAVFDSHVEKVEKPDPRFFEIALERSGSRREATVHVGDFYEIDVVGARRAGLQAILLDLYRARIDPPGGLIGAAIIGKIRGSAENSLRESLKAAKARTLSPP